MPRPTILRNVHALPAYRSFGPLDKRISSDVIIMTIEEYETVRLIDEKNLTQAECAEQMGVGRTTAQRIYNSARKKIANCIVYGKTLQFEGGDYLVRGQGYGRRQHGRGMNRNR